MCHSRHCVRTIVALAALLSLSQSLVAQTAHAAANPPCVSYFHVATSDGNGVRWNVFTPQMQKWWDRNAVPGLCAASDPRAADYVMIWRAETITVTQFYSLDVPLPPLGLDTPYPVAPSGATANSIPITRKERKVTIAVYSRTAADAPEDFAWREPTFSVSKSGRWPWSKPDKDALAEAVTRLKP